MRTENDIQNENLYETRKIISGIIKKAAIILVVPSAFFTLAPDTWLQYANLLSIKNSTIGTGVSLLFLICINIVIVDFLGKFSQRNEKGG